MTRIDTSSSSTIASSSIKQPISAQRGISPRATGVLLPRCQRQQGLPWLALRICIWRGLRQAFRVSSRPMRRGLCTTTRQTLVRIQGVESLVRFAEKTHYFALEAGRAQVVDDGAFAAFAVIAVVGVCGSEEFVPACTRGRPMNKFSSSHQSRCKRNHQCHDSTLTRTKHTLSHPQSSYSPLPVPMSLSPLRCGRRRRLCSSPSSDKFGRRRPRAEDTRRRSEGVGRGGWKGFLRFMKTRLLGWRPWSGVGRGGSWSLL